MSTPERLTVGVVMAIACASAQAADAYLARTIGMLVPFAAGGAGAGGEDRPEAEANKRQRP